MKKLFQSLIGLTDESVREEAARQARIAFYEQLEWTLKTDPNPHKIQLQKLIDERLDKALLEANRNINIASVSGQLGNLKKESGKQHDEIVILKGKVKNLEETVDAFAPNQALKPNLTQPKIRPKKK